MTSDGSCVVLNITIGEERRGGGGRSGGRQNRLLRERAEGKSLDISSKRKRKQSVFGLCCFRDHL